MSFFQNKAFFPPFELEKMLQITKLFVFKKLSDDIVSGKSTDPTNY